MKAIDQKADEYAYNEWRDFPEEQAIARKGFKAGAEYVLNITKNGWHNIKDNPQDLPTEDGQYLVYEIQYGDPWYDVAYFVTCANVFGTGHEKVIAWRELPKYEG